MAEVAEKAAVVGSEGEDVRGRNGDGGVAEEEAPKSQGRFLSALRAGAF